MSRWTGWTPIDVTGLDASLAPMGTGRGAELHQGAIIREMMRAAGENVENIPGVQEWLFAQAGFLWEVAVEYVIAGMAIDDAMELAFKRHMRALRPMARQVKLALDGIHQTPDGLASRKLHSWKATWKGLRRAETLEDFEDNFWYWHVAEKGYALSAQRAGLLPPGDATCCFEVLWARGDYKGGGFPKALATEVTWTAEELDSNWRVVLVNRARVSA